MNLDTWLGSSSTLLGAPDEAARAAAAWRRISAKPTSVAFVRPASVAANGTVTPETTLAAQSVRVESDNTATPSEGPTGQAAKRKVVVFGIKDHPTLGTTDMAKGYRFRFNGEEYLVRDIILTIGEIQGIGEAIA